MLRIGTRGSALALWQAETVRALLAPHAECELVIIHSSGDKDQTTPLTQLREPGFFTKELERALHDGRVDLAVHSLKDVPTQDPEGLTLIGILERGDPRDTLLIRPEAYAEGMPFCLKPNARVGTGSNRRRAQLHRLRPDLELLDLRGNVPTRLDKLRRGDYDAIMAAEAGLVRLEIDREGLISLPLSVFSFVPAPGQAAVAVQMRVGDDRSDLVRGAVHHPDTAKAITTERALMRRLEGGCQLPLGVHATKIEGAWTLLTSSAPAPKPGALPLPAGDVIELEGAPLEEMSAATFKRLRCLTGRDFVLTRGDNSAMAARIEDLGGRAHHRPSIQVRLRDVTAPSGPFDWVFLSSANGLRGLKAATATLPEARYAVVGPRTRGMLLKEGIDARLEARPRTAEGLVDALLSLSLPPQRILWPVGNLADPAPSARLAAAGHHVTWFTVYDTEAPEVIAPIDAIARPELIFFSPSAFEHFRQEVGIPEGARLISIGATTGRAIEAAGFTVDARASAPTIDALIEALTDD